VAPLIPTCRIVVPGWIGNALAGAAQLRSPHTLSKLLPEEGDPGRVAAALRSDGFEHTPPTFAIEGLDELVQALLAT
jgi:hypothetical protein